MIRSQRIFADFFGFVVSSQKNRNWHTSTRFASVCLSKSILSLSKDAKIRFIRKNVVVKTMLDKTRHKEPSRKDAKNAKNAKKTIKSLRLCVLARDF